MRQELELETEEAWFLVPKHAPNPVSDPAEEWGAKGASNETVATSGASNETIATSGASNETVAMR